ncbi:MAG TPA: thioredoxin family protein [Candidatus Sulfotelmatobacter sp.]|nr:thioredoxin family protein [Candidatus Sulfotelmatobacter sp.]
MPRSERGGPTRRTPLALLVVAATLLLARLGVGIWYEAHPEDRPDLVSWTPAPAAGRATPTGKPVLYVFTDPASKDSRRAEREVFADPALAQRIQAQFAPVRVEGPLVSPDPGARELRARFGVETLPAFVVTSPDGARFRKLEGYTSSYALMDSLRRAQLEMMDLPFIRGKSFRFQVGTPPPGAFPPDSLDQVPGR